MGCSAWPDMGLRMCMHRRQKVWAVGLNAHADASAAVQLGFGLRRLLAWPDKLVRCVR